MALDGTLSGLKLSLASLLNRADLADATLGDWISLAEAQMHRRFVGRQKQGLPVPRRLIKRSDASFALAAEYVAVPSDFAGPIDLLLTPATGNILDLDYLDSANLQSIKTRGYYPGYTFTQPATGCPKLYTVVGGQIQILPVADVAYTGELTYISRVAALTSTNTANWVLTDYPDAYLYGAALQSAPYLIADGRASMWAELFTAAVDDICNADPMPSDKSTLRTEIALIQTFSRPGGGRYNVNTDGY
jgi:hypothetical protein